MIRNILRYLCLSLIVIPGVVVAQTIPMPVDIHQPSQFPRGDGPIALVWRCSVSATGLLEGYFLIEAHDGKEQFGKFQSHDVALHTGFHEIPMMLPPIKVNNPYSEIKLKLSFVTKNKRYDFKDEYTLKVGQRFQRTFAVGVCDPFDINLLPETKQFLDTLKFESISPQEPISFDQKSIPSNQKFINNQPLSLGVKTVSIQIPPPDFPQLPIECHQYDILVITARGFEQLESRHLKAIHQWVRSGGSLCVLAGSVLEQPQLQFLNRLVEERNASPFLLDSEGKLELDQTEQIWFQRTGWGRSVIILSDALEKDQLSQADRNRVPFFLWKLRASQKTYYQKEKKWDYPSLIKVFLEGEQRARNRNSNVYTVNEMLNLNFRPIFTGGAVITDLMPAEMRIVPSWVIVTILFGYVLIIGPGKYYILGFFKIRRFTWITFPFVSICFACIAFMVSDYFMQTSYERKTLAIYDLDAQGKPVKENHFELLFTGAYQQIETKIKSGLFTPLNHAEFGLVQNYNIYARNISPSLVGPPFYSGSIPTQYVVYQYMPQWTPQLNRIIRNYPEDLKTNYDWSSIKVAELNSDQGRQKIRNQVKAAFGDQAQLLIYQGATNGDAKMFRLYLPAINARNQMRYSKVHALVNPMNQQPQQYPRNEEFQRSFMDDLCVRNQTGLFQIVSQTSPAGGNNYEDLSILDPSDPNQWLVVVYVPGKEQDIIYRQLIVAEI